MATKLTEVSGRISKDQVEIRCVSLKLVNDSNEARNCPLLTMITCLDLLYLYLLECLLNPRTPRRLMEDDLDFSDDDSEASSDFSDDGSEAGYLYNLFPEDKPNTSNTEDENILYCSLASSDSKEIGDLLEIPAHYLRNTA